jgi:hypothetical protein
VTNWFGLDLDNVAETSRDEIKAFRGEMLEARGGKFMHPLSAYSVLLENRPDMLKLQLRQANNIYVVPGEGEFRILAVTAMMNFYICHQYEDGIIHEVRAMQREGATKDQVNEMLAIALLHSGPGGMRSVYYAAFDYLNNYREPAHSVRFPHGWAPDPLALKSGIDFSDPAMSPRDLEALVGWYETTLGEVPRSIRFLAKHDPDYLKAWRAKFEGTLRGALPKQLLPYVLIHFNVNRGFASGIREAVLLGRAWGMTKAQVCHAITFANAYVAGPDGMYIVDDAVGDLLDEEWVVPPAADSP